MDTIVVNGYQKRRINSFVSASRSYAAADVAYRDLVAVYESDFGVCRLILCRAVPADTVLLLDSSRIDVVPLIGRSFHYKPLASTGDYEAGEVIGEYTLELRNESAHGMIRGPGRARKPSPGADGAGPAPPSAVHPQCRTGDRAGQTALGLHRGQRRPRAEGNPP